MRGTSPPPMDMDAEGAVLGTLLLKSADLELVRDFLSPQHFYADRHSRIYTAILALRDSGRQIDVVSVGGYLKDNDDIIQCGGMGYLTEVLNSFSPGNEIHHIEEHARRVVDKWRLRQMVSELQKIEAEIYHQPPEEVPSYIDAVERRIYDTARALDSKEQIESIVSAVQDHISHLEDIRSGLVDLNGVPSGFTVLDRLTGGLHDGDLTIIAARPGVGKSGLAGQIAKNVATRGNRDEGVALFSLEMPKDQLISRLACSESGIDMQRLRRNALTDDEWTRYKQAALAISRLPITINDRADISIVEIKSIVRRLKSDLERQGKRLRMVIVDYIQLVRAGYTVNKSRNREQEVGEISRALKVMAKDIGVPVIGLSQLNRDLERAEVRRKPRLSDLRECVSGESEVYDTVTGMPIKIKDLTTSGVALACVDDSRLTTASGQITEVAFSGSKPVVLLRTGTGREIRLTASHPVLTADGWKKVNKLVIGDRIASARKLPFPKVSPTLSVDQVRLLGYLISDGSYLKHRSVEYTKSDPACLSEVSELAYRLFGIQEKIHKNKRDTSAVSLTLTKDDGGPNNNPLINWLKEIGIHGQMGPEKMVPKAIWSCDEDRLRAFISTLWAGDGTVCRLKKAGAWVVKFSSSSYGLLRDIQTLLLRFGILSVIGRPEKKDKPHHFAMRQLKIAGRDNVISFGEAFEIPGIKGTRLRLALQWAKSLKENSRIDRLSISVNDRIKAASQRASLSWKELGYRVQGKEPSPETIKRVATDLQDAYLLRLANSDLLWDRICEISPCVEEDVYDIVVPEYGNFIANGVCCHNSGSLEQDADNVFFLWHPEPPEEASPTWMIELLVAKQRNGPTGECLLSLLRSCVRFTDLLVSSTNVGP